MKLRNYRIRRLRLHSSNRFYKVEMIVKPLGKRKASILIFL